jgi:hypothetical protein
VRMDMIHTKGCTSGRSASEWSSLAVQFFQDKWLVFAG